MSTGPDSTHAPGEWAELVTTERCNQRCLFCYAQHRADVPDPDLAALRQLFTEARAHTSRIILCGREALLRPDILEVLHLARELGLGVGVATNGQVLARPGRVEAIAAAGVDQLQVSFHFADRATFATWTQSDPEAYDRVLAGLTAVRDHNRAHPERRLGVATETELAAFNAGRLAQIVATLHGALGESFTAMRLGALIPTPMQPGAPLDLLEPFEERRRELAALLPTLPPGLDLKLDKAPLCLLPGNEHLSLGVVYLARGARLLDNHEGVQVLADDVVAVNAATEIEGQLRANPYRAVCRGCTLLPACRHRRTHWTHPAFAPPRAPWRPSPRRRCWRPSTPCPPTVSAGSTGSSTARRSWPSSSRTRRAAWRCNSRRPGPARGLSATWSTT
jgi:pyruvate-formate lyase-activating enzyme